MFYLINRERESINLIFIYNILYIVIYHFFEKSDNIFMQFQVKGIVTSGFLGAGNDLNPRGLAAHEERKNGRGLYREKIIDKSVLMRVTVEELEGQVML